LIARLPEKPRGTAPGTAVSFANARVSAPLRRGLTSRVMDGPVVEVSRDRWSGGKKKTARDHVAREKALEIRIGDASATVTMRTPGHDLDLVHGYLLTEGIIQSSEEIARVRPCPEARTDEGDVLLVTLRGEAPFRLDRWRRSSFVGSSCGICGKTSLSAVHAHWPAIDGAGPVESPVLASLPAKLRAAQEGFASTGGLHAAGIFSRAGDLRVVREDIGRHNAVDKAIGACREEPAVLADAILMVSGRVSFEIAQKALAARIPAVAAVSAPSSLAIDLARRGGQILVGFLREGGFNVYAGEERVRAGRRGRSARARDLPPEVSGAPGEPSAGPPRRRAPRTARRRAP